MFRVLVVAALLPPVLAAGEAPPLQELDALYARRDEPASLQTLEAALTSALKDSPEEYELLWRAARVRFWVADGSSDAGRKKQLAKEAWALAERAVAKAPHRPEGHFFAAVSIGSYSQAAGILVALAEGLEGKFNERLERALKLAPEMDHGGPLVTQGRYFYELPWPRRDLRRSAELLTQVTQRHPSNLRAWLYLAETQLAEGEPKKARASLDQVLAGAEEYDPPEARRVKAVGQQLHIQVQERLR